MQSTDNWPERMISICGAIRRIMVNLTLLRHGGKVS
jgi:hypothetical protein